MHDCWIIYVAFKINCDSFIVCLHRTVGWLKFASYYHCFVITNDWSSEQFYSATQDHRIDMDMTGDWDVVITDDKWWRRKTKLRKNKTNENTLTMNKYHNIKQFHRAATNDLIRRPVRVTTQSMREITSQFGHSSYWILLLLLLCAFFSVSFIVVLACVRLCRPCHDQIKWLLLLFIRLSRRAKFFYDNAKEIKSKIKLQNCAEPKIVGLFLATALFVCACAFMW